MKVAIRLIMFVLVIAANSTAEAETKLTPDLHLQMSRAGSPVASPDGSLAVYTVSDLNPEGDGRITNLWLLDIASGETRQITRGTSAGSPQWGRDGRGIYFTRDSQVWHLRLDGGEPEQVTNLPGGLSGYRLNPNPDAPAELKMLIHRRVHPDCPPADWECSEAAKERWNDRPGLVSELFPLRHWSSWRDSLLNHVFVGDPQTNRWVDLTPGWFECPPMALASGPAYSFSPDGSQACLIRNLDTDKSLSTNNDIFLVDLGLATASADTWGAATLISTGMSGGGGNDDQPHYAPNGRRIAYTSMERPGYESDLRRILLHDIETGEEHCLTCNLDRSAGNLTWSLDGLYLYFTAYDREATALYRIDISGGTIERLLRCGALGALEPLVDGRLLLQLESSRMPGEIFVCDPDRLAAEPRQWISDLAVTTGTWTDRESPLRQLTFHNQDRLAPLEMSKVEHFWFTGALEDSVHGFILSPSDRSREKNGMLPLVFVLHGGPQWAYHDFWLRSYNFQMIAAAGYAVATVNFHGSIGYGIEFQDRIRNMWGYLPPEDVEKGLDYLLATYDFIDPERVAAIGRSFGGFLVNSLNGRSDRFRCFVAHSGSFNEVAAWGSTEELWFPEWEFTGTPMERLDTYWANSPVSRAESMHTPTLVIHGQKDFRVDLSDGLMTYTTLRRQGVRARFLTYPNQGHHIHDPDSWRLMWREILNWLDLFVG